MVCSAGTSTRKSECSGLKGMSAIAAVPGADGGRGGGAVEVVVWWSAQVLRSAVGRDCSDNVTRSFLIRRMSPAGSDDRRWAAGRSDRWGRRRAVGGDDGGEAAE